MTNIPYILGKNAIWERKAAIEAQSDLFNEKQALLYKKHPLKLSVLQAFAFQNQIRAFFEKFVYTFEPYTRIELAKIEEMKATSQAIHTTLNSNIRLYSGLFAVWSLIKPDYDWFYVHKMSYLYRPPRHEILKRLRVSSLFALIAIASHHLTTHIGMCFYYPELIADLQIGDEFELGYWSRHFVKGLVSEP